MSSNKILGLIQFPLIGYYKRLKFKNTVPLYFLANFLTYNTNASSSPWNPIYQPSAASTSLLLIPNNVVSVSKAKPPKLIYVQKPWIWLRNKIKLKMLQYTWDRDFNEQEFKRGATQAIVVLTKFVRENNLDDIQAITTPNGFVQISQDMQISHTDPRVQLLRFRTEDIRRQIPVGIHLIESKRKRRHCVIDMFFVGLRGAEDMANADGMSVRRNMQLYRQQHDYMRHGDVGPENMAVFAELYVRFHREYSQFKDNPWNIAYFKVASFDMLNLK